MECSSLVFAHDLCNLLLLGSFCFRLSHGLLAFAFLFRRTAHLDFNFDVAFAFLAFAVFLAFVTAAICFTFHKVISLICFLGNAICGDLNYWDYLRQISSHL